MLKNQQPPFFCFEKHLSPIINRVYSFTFHLGIVQSDTIFILVKLTFKGELLFTEATEKLKLFKKKD